MKPRCRVLDFVAVHHQLLLDTAHVWFRLRIGHELGHLKFDGRQSRESCDTRALLIGSLGRGRYLNSPTNACSNNAPFFHFAYLVILHICGYIPAFVLAS